jgi:hypothetical protein
MGSSALLVGRTSVRQKQWHRRIPGRMNSAVRVRPQGDIGIGSLATKRNLFEQNGPVPASHPNTIPVWIVSNAPNQTGTQGICHDIAGKLLNVLLLPNRVIVIRALPNTSLAVSASIDGERRASFSSRIDNPWPNKFGPTGYGSSALQVGRTSVRQKRWHRRIPGRINSAGPPRPYR